MRQFFNDSKLIDWLVPSQTSILHLVSYILNSKPHKRHIFVLLHIRHCLKGQTNLCIYVRTLLLLIIVQYEIDIIWFLLKPIYLVEHTEKASGKVCFNNQSTTINVRLTYTTGFAHFLSNQSDRYWCHNQATLLYRSFPFQLLLTNFNLQ